MKAVRSICPACDLHIILRDRVRRRRAQAGDEFARQRGLVFCVAAAPGAALGFDEVTQVGLADAIRVKSRCRS